MPSRTSRRIRSTSSCTTPTRRCSSACARSGPLTPERREPRRQRPRDGRCPRTSRRPRGRSARRRCPAQQLDDDGRIRDVPVVGEVGVVDGAHERRTPLLACCEAGDARGEQPVARELARPPEGYAVLRAHALEVAPRVAPLGGEEVEGGGVPALAAEDGAQEERRAGTRPARLPPRCVETRGRKE